jgi:hypothetical protein
MQKILVSLICSFIAAIGYSQTIPVDYNNPTVQKGQRRTTHAFMKLLEQGKTDDAIKLIDPAFIKKKNAYRDSLHAYSKELSRYLKSTELSVVIVYPESQYNTYRCRYYNEKGTYFYIDLFFNVGQPNSLIARIWKNPEKELIAERKELAKRKKEEEKTGPPQPPPPPAFIEKKK